MQRATAESFTGRKERKDEDTYPGRNEDGTSERLSSKDGKEFRPLNVRNASAFSEFSSFSHSESAGRPNEKDRRNGRIRIQDARFVFSPPLPPSSLVKLQVLPRCRPSNPPLASANLGNGNFLTRVLTPSAEFCPQGSPARGGGPWIYNPDVLGRKRERARNDLARADTLVDPSERKFGLSVEHLNHRFPLSRKVATRDSTYASTVFRFRSPSDKRQCLRVDTASMRRGNVKKIPDPLQGDFKCTSIAGHALMRETRPRD